MAETYRVVERNGWSYVEGAPDPGPYRYRFEAQEYADELNAKAKRQLPREQAP